MVIAQGTCHDAKHTRSYIHAYRNTTKLCKHQQYQQNKNKQRNYNNDKIMCEFLLSLSLSLLGVKHQVTVSPLPPSYKHLFYPGVGGGRGGRIFYIYFL